MPTTYEPIATTTLGSAAAEITFSSIPSSYTDLRLVIVTNDGDTGNGGNFAMQFNGVTTSTYSSISLRGDGSTADSNSLSSFPYIALGALNGASGTRSFYTVDIFSYAGSTNKTILGTNSGDRNGAGQVQRCVGLWRSTSAITSIVVKSNNSPTRQLITGTTATLYGIKNA
jgi:hypothetical protein